MTLIWLVIWFVANLSGGHEPLLLDPVNAWTATLILAAALDFARPSSFKPAPRPAPGAGGRAPRARAPGDGAKARH